MPIVRKAREKPIEEADAIRDGHEKTFARTFAAALGQLLSPEMKKILEAGVKANKSTNAIINAMGFFDAKKPETYDRWANFAENIAGDYKAVINDTIERENDKRGWNVKPVKKVDDAEGFPVIPVNAGAGEFIRRRSLTRAVDLSQKEEQRIRAILQSRIGAGAHVSSPDLINDIIETVGLTDFQAARLGRKVNSARAAGMSFENSIKLRAVEALAIRGQRARAIARTETNDALSRGLNDSWKQAADSGFMPPGTQKRWVAMPEEENSSEECQDLHGDTVPVGEDFSTDAGEGFTGSGPPAHVNCRSTMILIFPK